MHTFVLALLLSLLAQSPRPLLLDDDSIHELTAADQSASSANKDEAPRLLAAPTEAELELRRREAESLRQEAMQDTRTRELLETQQTEQAQRNQQREQELAQLIRRLGQADVRSAATFRRQLVMLNLERLRDQRSPGIAGNAIRRILWRSSAKQAAKEMTAARASHEQARNDMRQLRALLQAEPITLEQGEDKPTVSLSRSGNPGLEVTTEAVQPVYAVVGGIVQFAGPLRGFEQIVILEHAEAYFTVYAHLSSLLVNEGDLLQQGDPLGLTGALPSAKTGTGVRLEVRHDDLAIDPFSWSELPSDAAKTLIFGIQTQ